MNILLQSNCVFAEHMKPVGGVLTHRQTYYQHSIHMGIDIVVEKILRSRYTELDYMKPYVVSTYVPIIFNYCL